MFYPPSRSAIGFYPDDPPISLIYQQFQIRCFQNLGKTALS